MAFEEKVLYLRLSPEFGGTRFGHFEQRVVRLGSDPGCDIAIAQGFGVAPEHVQVIFDGPTNIIIAPADRAADVYHWRPNATRPDIITTPTAIRPGESFALATPNGPRFIIELDELPPEVQERRAAMGGPRIGGRKLTGKAMADEVKRQAWTRILVMGPMQLVQRAYMFVKSGAILQPRNIILGVTILGGYIIGGASFCKMRSASVELDAVNERYEGCREEVSGIRNGQSDPIKMQFSDLVREIVGSNRVGVLINKDRDLAREVKDRVRSILASPDDYRWLLEAGSGRANSFMEWRNRVIELSELDGDTARIAVWLAAPPNAGPADDFSRGFDSEANDICMRGELELSYRQAVNLGLNPNLDAFHRGILDSINDNAVRKEMLAKTAASVGQELPEGITIDVVGVGNTSKEYCLFAEGDGDERTKRSALLDMVKRHFSISDKSMPQSNVGALSARVARFYSADLPSASYNPSNRTVEGIDFKAGGGELISRALKDEGPRGEWVLKRTADIFARAVAVPCLGVLDPNIDKKALQAVLGDDLPHPIHCLVLNYQLSTDG